jgi:hypothetical protein
MLTVCFDGSGKENSKHKIVTVAGFASFAAVWSEFERQWQERLSKDGLLYFHAADFAHSLGQFESWKEDESRRRALLVDLFNIIQVHGLRKFGCILHLDSFSEVKKNRAGQPGIERMEAFGFAAVKAVEAFYSFAKGEGVRANVRFVFEKGDPEDMLRSIFRARGFPDPDFAWNRPHADSKGIMHDPFIGLQAADWIAYEYYLDVQHLLYSGASDRWALLQFASLPGNIRLIYKDRLVPYIPNSEVQSKSIKKAIDALGRAASEGRRS